MPGLLDVCIPITRVTADGCIGSTAVNCSVSILPITPCGGDPINPPAGKCVSDIARRPWPSPPPIGTGCSPVSISVTNTVPDVDDPDQTLRIEGDVSYISGDVCLPRVNLKLVAPPAITSGGGTPNQSGTGYSTYKPGQCIPIGPEAGTKYKTPQDFYANEPAAEGFYPSVTPGGIGCQDCTAKSRYGAQATKFKLIGPFLATIEEFRDAQTTPVGAGANTVYLPFAWTYSFQPLFCVIAKDTCWEPCALTEDFDAVGADEMVGDKTAYNIKENTVFYEGKLTPGVDMEDMLKKGYKPQPIMRGTVVLMYGRVPWGTRQEYNPNTQKWVAVPEEESCDCKIVWFFDEQNAFAGDCADGTANQTPARSMLPQRNITSAGMFFGSDVNADRV